MKLLYLFLVSALFVAGCKQPSVDDPAPVPPVSVPEPPLVEMQSMNDSLYIDSQDIYTRTANSDLSIRCRFRIVKSPLTIKRIREYGFCLSTTDSVLSIKNPQHIRLTASFDSVNYQFVAATQNLVPGKDYYVEPYFIMQDGRVYYGRYVTAPRVQTPSWLPRPPFNSITRFRVTQPDKSVYTLITVASRATVPISALSYDFYSFVCKGNLYVLGRDGNLFQYDADQDKWVSRQRLTIEPGDRFNGWPAIVFGVNNKGYVLYTDAMAPNPTFHWEYDPDSDQWNKLTTANPPILASYNYTYQQGNDVFLSNTYQKSAIRFDATQKELKALALPNLVNYLVGNKSLLTVADQPYAYFGNYDEYGKGLLYIASYDRGNDQFGEARLISEKQNDVYPTLVATLANDVLFGLGARSELIRESRIYTQLLTVNDDLIRYSTTANQLIARYDLSTIRSGNNNAIWVGYKTFTLKNRVYAIDRSNNKMWELRF
ncbi:hypothetical protein [Spirosoma sp.]|uniref:hypothetical protein n=1 Tax=Spirosoma sp. TaxID=1899569 RepID=UPI003B3B9484